MTDNQHWIVNIGNMDGVNNFIAGTDYNMWGFCKKNNNYKGFATKAIRRDILWFKTSKKTSYEGKIIAVALYDSYEAKRPDDTYTQTIFNNYEWDTKLLYTHLCDLRNFKIDIKNFHNRSPILQWAENTKCENLRILYNNIIKERFLPVERFVK
jgi:hypothetical protein